MTDRVGGSGPYQSIIDLDSSKRTGPHARSSQRHLFVATGEKEEGAGVLPCP